MNKSLLTFTILLLLFSLSHSNELNLNKELLQTNHNHYQSQRDKTTKVVFTVVGGILGIIASTQFVDQNSAPSDYNPLPSIGGVILFGAGGSGIGYLIGNAITSR